MRISSLSGLICFSLALLPGGAMALEAARPQAMAPAKSYSSALDALRSGVRDYNKGNKLVAAQALEYAATQGQALALWKLGRMYADGDGVDHDDLKAFEYFSRLADQNAEESPDAPNAGVVSSAFVALGTYFLDGIKGSYVVADPVRAHDMFQYAASYFGDPNAQYNLGRLYLDGTGVAKPPAGSTSRRKRDIIPRRRSSGTCS